MKTRFYAILELSKKKKNYLDFDPNIMIVTGYF